MPVSLSSTVRVVLCTMCMVVGQVVSGQPDDLTGDFSRLSAKERARIAKEEQENAAKDLVFQGMMAEADAMFRKQEFDSSLSKYMNARALRPYNVYPKVKIEDLQALIAKRDEEKARSAAPVVVRDTARTEIIKMGRQDPSPVGIDQDVRSGAPGMTPVEKDPVKLTIPKDAPETSKPTLIPSSPTAVPVREPVPVLAEGERIYKEGRSVVVETIVAEDDHIIVYRKVSHPWGDQHYFREGLPISERRYRAALGR